MTISGLFLWQPLVNRKNDINISCNNMCKKYALSCFAISADQLLFCCCPQNKFVNDLQTCFFYGNSVLNYTLHNNLNSNIMTIYSSFYSFEFVQHLHVNEHVTKLYHIVILCDSCSKFVRNCIFPACLTLEKHLIDFDVVLWRYKRLGLLALNWDVKLIQQKL